MVYVCTCSEKKEDRFINVTSTVAEGNWLIYTSPLKTKLLLRLRCDFKKRFNSGVKGILLLKRPLFI